jgi:hypothetical protein
VCLSGDISKIIRGRLSNVKMAAIAADRNKSALVANSITFSFKDCASKIVLPGSMASENQRGVPSVLMTAIDATKMGSAQSVVRPKT